MAKVVLKTIFSIVACVSFLAPLYATETNATETAITDTVTKDSPLQRQEKSFYDILDALGIYVGRLAAYSMDEAIKTVKNSGVLKQTGTYYFKSKDAFKALVYKNRAR